MPQRGKRSYIILFVLLALVLMGGVILLWSLLGNLDAKQDKIYSGAKFVYNFIRQPFTLRSF